MKKDNVTELAQSGEFKYRLPKVIAGVKISDGCGVIADNAVAS